MILKILKYSLVVIIFAILIWIDLPENFPYLKPPFNLKTHYGLDLKGGTELIFEADLSKIKKEEITIDCEHSLQFANLSIKTSNQKGLLAFIMQKLEDLEINVATAKIHSNKKTVRDSFLMTKQNNLCNNTQKILDELTIG